MCEESRKLCGVRARSQTGIRKYKVNLKAKSLISVIVFHKVCSGMLLYCTEKEKKCWLLVQIS